MTNAIDRHDRERLDLIVITRVVAKWTFGRGVSGLDMTLERDLCRCGNDEIGAQAAHDARAFAAQQTGKRELRNRIRNRCDGCEHAGRICTDADRERKRLARSLGAPALEIDRSAAMGEPAHDDSVASDDLGAIDP